MNQKSKTPCNQRLFLHLQSVSQYASGGIRTHGLQSRSLTLYPSELRALMDSLDFTILGG